MKKQMIIDFINVHGNDIETGIITGFSKSYLYRIAKQAGIKIHIHTTKIDFNMTGFKGGKGNQKSDFQKYVDKIDAINRSYHPERWAT